jgi:hypothetical protein
VTVITSSSLSLQVDIQLSLSELSSNIHSVALSVRIREAPEWDSEVEAMAFISTLK